MLELYVFFPCVIIVSFLLFKKHQVINRLYISTSVSLIIALLYFLDIVENTLYNVFPHTLFVNGDGLMLFGFSGFFFGRKFHGLHTVLSILWCMIIILVAHTVLLLSLHIVMISVQRKKEQNVRECSKDV